MTYNGIRLSKSIVSVLVALPIAAVVIWVIMESNDSWPRGQALNDALTPMITNENTDQSSAAAAKVIGLLNKSKLVNNPCVSIVDETLCSGCLACTEMCPYDAISFKNIEIDDHGQRIQKIVAEVNEALCHGCGGCTVTCRPGAIDLKGFTNKQILAEVDAICR